jgi:hypothetical protein
MAGLALIISIIALILSYLAYTRSGGSTEELKTKVEDLGISTENFREKTADALNRLEKMMRGGNKKAKEKEAGETETVDRETEGQKDSTQ